MPLRNLNLHIARHTRRPHRTRPPAASAVIAKSSDALAARDAASFDAQAAVGFELALQAETLLALFAELALGAFGDELRGGVRGLEFVDGLQEVRDFVAGFGEVVGEDGDGFFAAFDLRL